MDFVTASATAVPAGPSILLIITALICIVLFGISIYCFVLFVKLAHRGIKALDIYINKNQN